MNVLDLFSGIGGFSVGLERAGYRTTAFCEIDPYCREVLARHWPGVPIHNDIRHLYGTQYAGTVDVVCGGFPCQDLSRAGRGEGLAGETSGLWYELLRVVDEVKPRYLLAENVLALRNRGLDHVLGSLAEIGYDAEWHSIPASAVGAPHRRDRLWIIAYPRRDETDEGRPLVNALCVGDRMAEGPILSGWNGAEYATGWLREPDVGRVADGVPFRVDRLRTLGNAVVPQIVTLIGRAVVAHEQQHGLAA